LRVAAINPRQALDLAKDPGHWTKRTFWMRGPWPMLRRPCVRPWGLCRMRRLVP
jgi:hypothetical protein